MIDWVFVGLNALWIFGLSLVLATLSLAFYTASYQNKKLFEVLKGYATFLNLGMLLICLGSCGLARTGWERLLWGVLALGTVANLWVETHKLVLKP